MNEDEPGGRRLRMISALLGLVYSLMMLWCLIPAHQRQLIRMRLIAGTREGANRCARRAGDSSMAAELRTGARLYQVPYTLARLRDRLGDAYERERKGLN